VISPTYKNCVLIPKRKVIPSISYLENLSKINIAFKKRMSDGLNLKEKFELIFKLLKISSNDN